MPIAARNSMNTPMALKFFMPILLDENRLDAGLRTPAPAVGCKTRPR
jgi:hypothetical protein